jgi:hypothetical protein
VTSSMIDCSGRAGWGALAPIDRQGPPSDRRRPPRRPGRAALIACLLIAGAALPAAAQSGSRDRGRAIPPPPSLAGVPGFVEFSDLGVTAPGKVTLRVALHGPLLRFMAEAARGEEPGFSELIDKLQGIFAQIYELPPGSREAIERQTEATARLLERRGWQTVVEVHDAAGDSSYLQVRSDGERILGLAVMFVDPEDGSAGFINVVGDITPEDVGRLGRTFDIDALERFGESGAGRREEKP